MVVPFADLGEDAGSTANIKSSKTLPLLHLLPAIRSEAIDGRVLVGAVRVSRFSCTWGHFPSTMRVLILSCDWALLLFCRCNRGGGSFSLLVFSSCL